MIHIIILFAFCTVLSLAVIRCAIYLALACNITDDPGGRKLHDTSTPFVGGVGVFMALSIGFTVLLYAHPEQMQQWMALGLCSIIIFGIGFIDDILWLNYKLRFIIQALAVLFMILIGNVVIYDLGELFFGLPLHLGLFAIPFTIFCVIGCINALNMVDGIDGLSGSISLVSLLLIGVVALTAGDLKNLILITVLAGGVVGFLYFNLRYPTQNCARVFLGDNGSMLLGFLLAWLLVDLSQGTSPAIKPITAVWLLSIPLMDTISVMHRRMKEGKSPFTPDRNHLHHILLRSGFRVQEVVFAIVSLHLFLGMIGLAGFYLGVPDFIMLLAFLLVYLGYFNLTLRPWRFIPALRYLHTQFGLASTASSGTFLGGYTAKNVERLTQIISEALGPSMDFWVKVFEQQLVEHAAEKRYAVALNIRLPENEGTLDEKITGCVALLQEKIKEQHGVRLRQFVARFGDSDRRRSDRRNTVREASTSEDNRISDRRALERRAPDLKRRASERRAWNRDSLEQRSKNRRASDRRVSDRHKLGSHVLVFEATYDWLQPGHDWFYTSMHASRISEQSARHLTKSLKLNDS